MADKVSIAIRQEQAFGRLNQSALLLSERFGVAVPVMPTQGRDTELLRATQFEALADWAEGLVELSGQAEVEMATDVIDYESMTKAELVFEARERKIDVSGMRLKSEVIDALQASDAMTEDEQQAADGSADEESEA